MVSRLADGNLKDVLQQSLPRNILAAALVPRPCGGAVSSRPSTATSADHVYGIVHTAELWGLAVSRQQAGVMSGLHSAV